MAKSQAQQDAQSKAREALNAQREERKKATDEALKRAESSKPTPTQEENDLARLGISQELADDGSGQTVITTTVVANEPLQAGGYSPRSRARQE